jgi:hypothetical protein
VVFERWLVLNLNAILNWPRFEGGLLKPSYACLPVLSLTIPFAYVQTSAYPLFILNAIPLYNLNAWL